jgi:hypothetical protein
MNKEQILQATKDMMIMIRDNSGPINKKLVHLIQKEASALNADDMAWIDAEYSKFYQKEIVPYLPKEIKNNS